MFRLRCLNSCAHRYGVSFSASGRGVLLWFWCCANTSSLHVHVSSQVSRAIFSKRWISFSTVALAAEMANDWLVPLSSCLMGFIVGFCT